MDDHQKIEGWFGKLETQFYLHQAKCARAGAKFVEIGSWKGRSTYCMAAEIRRLAKPVEFWCIDTWEETDDSAEPDTLYNEFLKNIEPVRDYVRPIRAPSLEAVEMFDDGTLDFVFIDAAHDFDNVLADIRAWRPKVKPTGVLAGHDYGRSWPGVVQAVEEAFNGQARAFGTCWYVGQGAAPWSWRAMEKELRWRLRRYTNPKLFSHPSRRNQTEEVQPTKTAARVDGSPAEPAVGSQTSLRWIPPEPDIALIVSTYQQPRLLKCALASIAAQERVGGRIEVVVSDDGSTDETSQVVQQFADSVSFPVLLTTHPRIAYQLARCRNEGAAASKAPYLLFLDGDCVLPPGHVFEHIKRRRPGYAMGADCCRLDRSISSRFDTDAIRSGEYLDWVPRSEVRAVAKRARKARYYQLIHHPTKPRLIGNNMGIWRSDFERINGFDENFEGWGCEDDDLRIRLRRAGVQVASILRWTWTCHLWHPVDPTAPATGWRHGANVRYLNRKGRLTRCMRGLVKRSVDDLGVRVVGTTDRPNAAAALVKSRWADCPKRPEVEILFVPGQGKFTGGADCNILVVLEDAGEAQRMLRKADLVVADRLYPEVAAECQSPLADFDRALEKLGGPPAKLAAA